MSRSERRPGTRPSRRSASSGRVVWPILPASAAFLCCVSRARSAPAVRTICVSASRTWTNTTSAAPTMFSSSSRRDRLLTCMPGSSHSLASTGTVLLVAHITMSAPDTASRAVATASTSMPSLHLHRARERLAPFTMWAVATYPFDIANRADRHRLRAGLPTCAEQGDLTRVGRSQKFRREPACRAGPHALRHAVGIDRERFAGVRAEQQDQTDIAVIRRRWHFDASRARGRNRPRQNIGSDAHRANAEISEPRRSSSAGNRAHRREWSASTPPSGVRFRPASNRDRDRQSPKRRGNRAFEALPRHLRSIKEASCDRPLCRRSP